MNITLTPSYDTLRSDYSAHTPNGNKQLLRTNVLVTSSTCATEMYILTHRLSSLDYRKMFLRQLILSDIALFHVMATFPIKQAECYSVVTYRTIQ